MIRLPVLCLVATLLVGCANTSSIKSTRDHFNNKTVAIVPTGAVRTGGGSTVSVGPVFGPVGMVVERIVTQNSGNTNPRIVTETMGVDHALAAAQGTIEASVGRLGAVAKVRRETRSRPGEDFNAWFNPEKRDIEEVPPDTDLIVDFGFESLTLTDYMMGTYAEAIVGIRVVDARTGQVIARARTASVGSRGVKVLKRASDPGFGAEVSAAFEKVIHQVTHEAILKIAH